MDPETRDRLICRDPASKKHLNLSNAEYGFAPFLVLCGCPASSSRNPFLLSHYPLSAFSHLLALSLSNCNIHSLYAFPTLSYLQKLVLSQNHLTLDQLAYLTHKTLPQLHTLDLGYNNIKHVPWTDNPEYSLALVQLRSQFSRTLTHLVLLGNPLEHELGVMQYAIQAFALLDLTMLDDTAKEDWANALGIDQDTSESDATPSPCPAPHHRPLSIPMPSIQDLSTQDIDSCRVLRIAVMDILLDAYLFWNMDDPTPGFPLYPSPRFLRHAVRHIFPFGLSPHDTEFQHLSSQHGLLRQSLAKAASYMARFAWFIAARPDTFHYNYQPEQHGQRLLDICVAFWEQMVAKPPKWLRELLRKEQHALPTNFATPNTTSGPASCAYSFEWSLQDQNIAQVLYAKHFEDHLDTLRGFTANDIQNPEEPFHVYFLLRQSSILVCRRRQVLCNSVEPFGWEDEQQDQYVTKALLTQALNVVLPVIYNYSDVSSKDEVNPTDEHHTTAISEDEPYDEDEDEDFDPENLGTESSEEEELEYSEGESDQVNENDVSNDQNQDFVTVAAVSPDIPTQPEYSQQRKRSLSPALNALQRQTPAKKKSSSKTTENHI